MVDAQGTIGDAPVGKPLEKAAVRELAATFRGELVLPGEDRYDAVRAVYNGMIDRWPALVARCTSVEDVIAAVDFAREGDLLVAVRSGGHSVAGHSVCDGGVVIDLSPMKGIRIDPVERTARAEAGLTIGELIPEIEKSGLVTATGTASGTGIGGLTLGGGYGWLMGKYGMALDNVLVAEVVTADGRLLEASETQNPDLFWAIRGGSGNFGIVSAFEFRLHPVRQVLGGMVIHPYERARDVLRFYRDFSATTPDELTTYAGLVTTPHGHRAIAIALCYCGPIGEGERMISPLRSFGPPVQDLIRPMAYSEMNTMFDAALPPGLPNYWKWNGLRELSDEAIDTILDCASRVPSLRTVVLLEHLHGAARRVSPTAAAFPHRDAQYSLIILSQWTHPADTGENMAWTREFSAATEPFSTSGVYVNGLSEGDERPRAAYGINYDRLVEVKNRYDPTNFFRLNQNIKPTM